MTNRPGRRSVEKASATLRLLVFLLFNFSGATALVYQIAWVRSLTLTVGASHEAVGIVLAAFMGGLALGGFTFGRWSERISNPLRLYGLLEIGIGLAAFVLPALLRLADGIYVAAALRVEGVPWPLNLLRVANDIRVARRLAWLLATVPDAALRDGIRAVRLTQALDRATNQRVPQVMDTLAAALAETGRFQEAIDVAVRAAEIATALGQPGLAERIEARIWL